MFGSEIPHFSDDEFDEAFEFRLLVGRENVADRRRTPLFGCSARYRAKRVSLFVAI